QAEDGIRDLYVTGVQTCALPICWPVDPAVEQAENPELAPLTELEPGSRATIVRLAEHDGDLLHWFYDQGLAPGTEIELRAAEPETGRASCRERGVRAVGGVWSGA